MDLSLRGFKVDEARRRELAEEAAAQCDELKREIRRVAPFDLFGKGKRKGEDGKGLSNPKVTAYFYDTLKCRAYIKRSTGSRTCDEEAIRRLMRHYKKAVPVGKLILDFRMWQKRGEFVDPSIVDDDGYFRSLYTPTAVSGRLQSMENPLGSAGNAQNYPRPPSPVRSIFVPDRGHILLEWDYNRVELRLLSGMSGDRRMMAEAVASPEVDPYSDVAEELAIADRLAEMSLPTSYARATGKRVLLASGYGMQGETMSKAALLETEGALDLDPRQCDQWLEELRQKRKGIPRYQAWVQGRVVNDGYLENSWGRRYYFRVLRLTDGHFRDGFAWCCQSENGVNMNQLGFVPAHRLAKASNGQFRVVQQGHDSLVASVDPRVSWEYACRVADNLEIEREYPGAGGPWTLGIPVGYKLGPRWGSAMREWKTRPTKREWDAAVQRAVEEVWWRKQKAA